MKKILLFYAFAIIYCANGEDIFDMFHVNQKPKNPVIEPVASEQLEPATTEHLKTVDQSCKKNSSRSFLHEYQTVVNGYRAFVRQWLQKFPTKTTDRYQLIIELTSAEFERLEKFAKEPFTPEVSSEAAISGIHAINEIFKDGLTEARVDNMMGYSSSWSVWIRSFDFNYFVRSALLIASIMGMSFVFIRARLRRSRFISACLLVGFIFSVAQNWYTLYLEAQAKVEQVLMKKMPDHCNGHSIGFFQTITAAVGRLVKFPVDDCFEFHRARLASPLHQVTIVQAFALTYGQMFATPLGVIGEGVSKFFSGLLQHVPIYLWPVIVLITVPMIIVLILVYSGYEIQLPFMMGVIRPGAAHHAALENQQRLVNQLKSQIQQLQERQSANQEEPALQNSQDPPAAVGFRPEYFQ